MYGKGVNSIFGATVSSSMYLGMAPINKPCLGRVSHLGIVHCSENIAKVKRFVQFVPSSRFVTWELHVITVEARIFRFAPSNSLLGTMPGGMHAHSYLKSLVRITSVSHGCAYHMYHILRVIRM